MGIGRRLHRSCASGCQCPHRARRCGPLVYGSPMRFSRAALLTGLFVLSATAALAGPHPVVVGPVHGGTHGPAVPGATTAAHIRDLVQAGGKAVTDQERAVIGRHWRHTMRLLRVRNLAELDSDTPDTARVDALMTTADLHLDASLKALNAKAPKADQG